MKRRPHRQQCTYTDTTQSTQHSSIHPMRPIHREHSANQQRGLSIQKFVTHTVGEERAAGIRSWCMVLWYNGIMHKTHKTHTHTHKQRTHIQWHNAKAKHTNRLIWSAADRSFSMFSLPQNSTSNTPATILRLREPR